MTAAKTKDERIRPMAENYSAAIPHVPYGTTLATVTLLGMLAVIIEVLNERFGTQFGEGNALFAEQLLADAKADHGVVGRAMANPLDNFELSMKPVIGGLVMDRMERNEGMGTAHFNEADFGNRFFKAVVRRVYEEIRKPASQPPPSR